MAGPCVPRPCQTVQTHDMQTLSCPRVLLHSGMSRGDMRRHFVPARAPATSMTKPAQQDGLPQDSDLKSFAFPVYRGGSQPRTTGDSLPA